MKAFFIAPRALKKSLSDLSKSISLRNHPFKGTTATDAKDFQAPQAGRIVRTAQGHPAFVPAPLPPRLDYFDLGNGVRPHTGGRSYQRTLRIGPNTAPVDVRKIRNYVTALQYGIARLHTLPLMSRLVRNRTKS